MNSLPQLKHLGLFDARVPRYTSYPTAPHFFDRIGPDDTRGWLRALTSGSQISLYVHIPFCRRLCWFCACRTQGTATAAPVAAYLETLKRELALVAADLPQGIQIGHLHWGGGTPTLLSPEMIADLAGAIFDVAPLATGAQFSVEIDPSEVDGARLDRPLADATAMTPGLEAAFPGAVLVANNRVDIPSHTRPLVRMIARHFDAYEVNAAGHSHAV